MLPARTKGLPMKRFAILVAGVLAAVPATSLHAQSANTQAISVACSVAATSCVTVVRAEIAALRAAGLGGAALDAQLGQIAAAVQLGGANTTLVGRAIAVGMMREVAAQVSDPAQEVAILQAATSLEDGILDPLPLIVPQQGSPS